MNKHLRILSALLVVGFAFDFGAAAPAAPGADEGVDEFDEFEVFIEINATDGDAGLQGKLDGEAWRKAKVSNPDGRAIFHFRPATSLRTQGVTEIQWESDEPTFDEFPLDKFLERFPEGEYTVEGITIDNDLLMSETDLTHDLPAGPVITSPADGDEVELDGGNLTVSWDEVTDDFQGGPLGSDIVSYQLVAELEFIVMGEEVVRVFSVDVAPDTYSAEIPADFLMPDMEYKIEVGAREESGNQTFTELSICTVDDVPNT